MGRARDIANVLSSSTNIALDSELGLSLITPTSIAVTGGSGSISTSGAVSFTSASAISLNGCFTSSYENYHLIIDSTGSTTAVLYQRLRTSGTDASGSNYSSQELYNSNATTVATYRVTNQTTWQVIGDLSNRFVAQYDIYTPQLTKPTGMISSFVQPAIGNFVSLADYSHSLSTAYDGMTFYPTVGTITGTIRVYGYRN